MDSTESPSSQEVDTLPVKAQVFHRLLSEKLLLQHDFPSSDDLSQKIRKIERLKDGSYYNLYHDVPLEDREVNGDELELNKVPPMLYRDLGWEHDRGDLWPIRPGDFSPLSPDGDLPDRGGKIGIDFWRWHRDNTPLGYTPPLCTCRRTRDAKEMLKHYALGVVSVFKRAVCENEVCRGLLYVPYSIIEVPLNRKICNGSQFVVEVDIPNDTDVYCGNMKHTIVICTTSPDHEAACLKAIEKSEVPESLVYDVKRCGFLSYFKKQSSQKPSAEVMSVEPIDSDVSDSCDSYGFGEMFALKVVNGKLVIHRYNSVNKVLMPLDIDMLRMWQGAEEISPQNVQMAAEVTSIHDYVLCELIESFANERRPLTYILRGSTPPPYPEDFSELFSTRLIKRRSTYCGEDRVPVSHAALAVAHKRKILSTLRDV